MNQQETTKCHEPKKGTGEPKNHNPCQHLNESFSNLNQLLWSTPNVQLPVFFIQTKGPGTGQEMGETWGVYSPAYKGLILDGEASQWESLNRLPQVVMTPCRKKDRIKTKSKNKQKHIHSKLYFNTSILFWLWKR